MACPGRQEQEECDLNAASHADRHYCFLWIDSSFQTITIHPLTPCSFIHHQHHIRVSVLLSPKNPSITLCTRQLELLSFHSTMVLRTVSPVFDILFVSFISRPVFRRSAQRLQRARGDLLINMSSQIFIPVVGYRHSRQSPNELKTNTGSRRLRQHNIKRRPRSLTPPGNPTSKS